MEIICQWWSGIWLSINLPTGGGGQVVLCVDTQVTALCILHYIVTHPWPTEIVSYQVGGLPLAQVASDWTIMEGVHYVVFELAIGRDVNTPSVEYQAIPFLPFLTM